MSDLAARPLAELALEPETRPVMPPIEGATDVQREKGGHLALIHRHYLQDVARIAAVLERIRAGDDPPERLQQIVLAVDMGQNLRAFGSICGQACQILTMHHNIEQAHMFPQLEAANNTGLSAVVARLRAEHEVVHELLIRLEAAARDLAAVASDAQFETCGEIFERLEAVVRSHFRYEETELAEAIGYYLDGI